MEKPKSDIVITLRPALASHIKEHFEGASDQDKVAAYLNTRREFIHNNYVVTEHKVLRNGHTQVRGYIEKTGGPS